MSRRLIVSAKAEADVESVLAYLSLFSANVAENFLAEYVEIIQSLLAFPKRGPIELCDPNETLRRVVMPRFRNYLIFYRNLPDAITVLHVFHSSRDIPALLRDSGDI